MSAKHSFKFLELSLIWRGVVGVGVAVLSWIKQEGFYSEHPSCSQTRGCSGTVLSPARGEMELNLDDFRTNPFPFENITLDKLDKG